MDILVLDAIHGGQELAGILRGMGHRVDLVDVYRGGEPAIASQYDLVISPVHLDPGNPVLRSVEGPRITHHQAVRWILGQDLPDPLIEITGARGKTTTAHALAHLMDGAGVLHTSKGTFLYPERQILWRKSITPASLIPAARYAREIGGWCIAEVSLGLTGVCTLGIITSAEDYSFAGGMKQALAEKIRSAEVCKELLVATGVEARGQHTHAPGDIVSSADGVCTYRMNGKEGTFSSPLLNLAAYRDPLLLAAAAACILGICPSGLETFSPLEGRWSTSRVGDVLVLDNANSGTNRRTTEDAAAYARKVSGEEELTLVIGMEAHAVCEGFPADEIGLAIRNIRPARVVLVGEELPELPGVHPAQAPDLREGYEIARSVTRSGSILLAVKTWR
jgi:hypothetical protein